MPPELEFSVAVKQEIVRVFAYLNSELPLYWLEVMRPCLKLSSYD